MSWITSIQANNMCFRANVIDVKSVLDLVSAVKQQTIAWFNADQDLRHIMALFYR